MLIRLASFLLIVLLVTVGGEAQTSTRTESFTSGGKTIQVEVFPPASAGKHPAVMLLYGAGGLTRRGDNFRQYGTRLAEHGFVAFLVHYFDATNSEQAGVINSERFPLWWKAVYDGVGFAQHQAGVDKSRIGVLGFSLGGYVALAEASQDNRVKAVAEYYGGMSDDFQQTVTHMPPTLILHGDQDSVIPVSQAYDLHKFLRKLGASSELRIYPGQEHGFDSNGDPAAAKDAWQRMLAFFDRYLGNR
jgi:carboxymethylenebutenolidase